MLHQVGGIVYIEIIYIIIHFVYNPFDIQIYMAWSSQNLQLNLPVFDRDFYAWINVKCRNKRGLNWQTESEIAVSMCSLKLKKDLIFILEVI